MIPRRTAAVSFITAGLVAVAVLYIASPTGATRPFNPVLEITAISDQAASADADITFRTTLRAGEDFLALYMLETASNTWKIAGDIVVPDGYITAIATMAVDVGALGDPDCDSSIESFTFNLRDVPPDPTDLEPPLATWFGNISGFWTLTLEVEGSLLEGFVIQGTMTAAVGVNLCTPLPFTITFCGRANPNPSATTCGSGSDPVVMTNPVSAGTNTWNGTFLSDLGHFAVSSDSICIGTSCPTLAPAPSADATATAGNLTDRGDGEPWPILIGGSILALVVVGYGGYRLVRRRRRSPG